jgi:hypothetical protein
MIDPSAFSLLKMFEPRTVTVNTESGHNEVNPDFR